MLANVYSNISSLVETPPRRSANLIVVWVVGSPRLHPFSCELAASLSESSSRVIITERNLRHWSDLMVSEAKKYSDVHYVSAVWRRSIW